MVISTRSGTVCVAFGLLCTAVGVSVGCPRCGWSPASAMPSRQASTRRAPSMAFFVRQGMELCPASPATLIVASTRPLLATQMALSVPIPTMQAAGALRSP